jgi:hypothetical protein
MDELVQQTSLKSASVNTGWTAMLALLKTIFEIFKTEQNEKRKSECIPGCPGI